MSQIVKTGLAKSMNKHIKFCNLRVIFQIKETPFVSKILFLKHYGQVRFIHFLHFKVRISEHLGLPQEPVNQLNVPYQPLFGMTCLFLTIK